MKMNPFHTSHVHGPQSVRGLVDVEELRLLLHERQRALEVVAPAVVLAGELPAASPGLLIGKVIPHQLVSAVPADVVERPDLSSLPLTTITEDRAASISLVK